MLDTLSRHKMRVLPRHPFLRHERHQPVDRGIRARGVAGSVVLHDGLRRLVAVAGDVADRQKIRAGAIEQHDAGVAEILIVLEVRRAGALVDEGQRRAGGDVAVALDRKIADLGEQMPVGVLVILAACGLIDDDRLRHVAQAKPHLELGNAELRGGQARRELRRFLDGDNGAGLALLKLSATLRR